MNNYLKKKLLLRNLLLVGIGGMLAAWPVVMQAQQRYRVAACDWMMLKRQKLGEFQLTRYINADGAEMDM